MRVLALDYGSARCGCAVSDPTGVLATPIEPVSRAATRRGLRAVARARRRARGRARGRRAAAVAVRRRLRTDRRDARVRRRARARAPGPGRALRRAVHDAARRAHSGGERARTRARPRTCSRAGWPRTAGRLVADWQERTAEEREAARLERERRRSGAIRASRASAAVPKRSPTTSRTTTRTTTTSAHDDRLRARGASSPRSIEPRGA